MTLDLQEQTRRDDNYVAINNVIDSLEKNGPIPFIGMGLVLGHDS